jgi:NAD(P)H-dependent FMN reductase
MIKLQLIIGSTRQNRQSEIVARWVQKELEEYSFDVEILDLKDYPLPFFDEPAPIAALGGNYSSNEGKRWAQKVGKADAYLVITPEYNHGYPAVLKNALDYAYYEWEKKPIAFVSYGGSASGSRSVEQLRLVAIELQMVPIREAVHLPIFQGVFDENGELIKKHYNKTLSATLDQLHWYAKALKEAKRKDLEAELAKNAMPHFSPK